MKRALLTTIALLLAIAGWAQNPDTLSGHLYCQSEKHYCGRDDLYYSEPYSYFGQQRGTGIYEYAERFVAPAGSLGGTLDTLVYDFGMPQANSAADYVTIRIYPDQNGLPGPAIYSQDIPYSQLVGGTNLIPLPGVTVPGGTFYIGFLTYDAFGDIAVMSTRGHCPGMSHTTYINYQNQWLSPDQFTGGPYFLRIGYHGCFLLPNNYTVTTTASPAEGGSVSGAGTYEEGTTVTLTATPNPGHLFLRWQDGSTDNPRTILLTQDTTFTAYFAPDNTEGINDNGSRTSAPRLYPNPATTSVTVEGYEGEVQVVDLQGRTVLRSTETTLDLSSLPAGTYFVKLGNAVQKLIVK